MLSIKKLISSIEDSEDRARAEKAYNENKEYFETILIENSDLDEEEVAEILIDELTEINLEDFYESKN